MSIVDKPRRRRVFIASSQSDVAQVQEAMEDFDLDAVTLEQSAQPSTTWVDSLHRCVHDADMVVGIMGDRRHAMNVFFELGVASALNKPTVLFLTPDSPLDLIPPSGIPYLRMDLRNKEAVRFGLNQMMSLAPRDPLQRSGEGFTTRPLGPIADALLARLPSTNPREFEDLVYEALRASGAPAVARGDHPDGLGIDFAVWSHDLEPTIANPLLIECKASLGNSDVNEVIGRMFRALEAIPNGCGLVLYKEAASVPQGLPKSLPVVFVAVHDFLNSLRETGLAEYVRRLRNAAHGS